MRLIADSTSCKETGKVEGRVFSTQETEEKDVHAAGVRVSGSRTSWLPKHDGEGAVHLLPPPLAIGLTITQEFILCFFRVKSVLCRLERGDDAARMGHGSGGPTNWESVRQSWLITGRKTSPREQHRSQRRDLFSL